MDFEFNVLFSNPWNFDYHCTMTFSCSMDSRGGQTQQTCRFIAAMKKKMNYDHGCRAVQCRRQLTRSLWTSGNKVWKQQSALLFPRLTCTGKDLNRKQKYFAVPSRAIGSTRGGIMWNSHQFHIIPRGLKVQDGFLEVSAFDRASSKSSCACCNNRRV
jgi:hypothetical protein